MIQTRCLNARLWGASKSIQVSPPSETRAKLYHDIREANKRLKIVLAFMQGIRDAQGIVGFRDRYKDTIQSEAYRQGYYCT